MRSCPTLNNNITNNYKTMMEDAPNATDHDDDSKRIASSYSYDLPNQEPNQDGDVSLVPPDILTIAGIFNFNRTEIALLMKEIKSKVGIPIQSNNIPSVSDRTVSIVKSPTPSSSSNDNKLKRPSYINTKAPSSSSNDNRLKRSSSNNNKATSSSECVINYDTNFDRDNPISSHDRSLPTNLLPATTTNNNIPSVSYNVLSNRTDNNFNPPPSERAINSDANFDRDNPSPWSNINNNNVSNHNNNNDYNNNNNAPPSSSNNNNINGLYNNNFVTDKINNFVTDKINNFVTDKINNNFVTDKMVTDTRFTSELPSIILPPSLVLNALPPSSELKSVSYKVLSHRTASNITLPSPKSPLLQSIKPSSVSYNALPSLQSIRPQSIKPPLSNNNNNDNNYNQNHNHNNSNNSSNAPKASNASIPPNSLPPSSEPPLLQSSKPTPSISSNQSPLLNKDNNNNNNSNNALINEWNQNNKNKVSYTNTVLVTTSSTSGTACNVNAEIIFAVPGMINATKYVATENHVTEIPSTSKISIAHEESHSKYAATENHATEKWKFSSPRSKTSIAHGETSVDNYKSLIYKYAATENQVKSSSTRSNNSIAHEGACSRTPITSRTTRKVIDVTHTMKSKILGTTHIRTNKYAETENHVTKIPSTQSKISIAHEEARTAIPKFSSTRTRTSIAHEETGSKYDATDNHVKSSSNLSNISIAHEEDSSTAIPNVLKSSELSSARPYISITHGSKHTRNIDKYTSMENQSSLNGKLRYKNWGTHGIHDKPTVKLKINMVLLPDGMDTKYAKSTEQSGIDTKYHKSTEQSSTHIVNNSSFCSQYSQTVLKITNKENNNNNNNNNGTFNNIMLLLLHPIIPIHPFIEFLQPEPEPPPLNSHFLLILFLFIGKTKQSVVIFILKSLTLIKHNNNNSDTLSYINNIKSVLTHHHVWSSSSFSAPLKDSKFLQIRINHTLLTHTKTNLLLFIPEFRFCKCGEV